MRRAAAARLAALGALGAMALGACRAGSGGVETPNGATETVGLSGSHATQAARPDDGSSVPAGDPYIALAADPPAFDPVLLAARLGRVADPEGARARTEPPSARRAGDVQRFRVHDIVGNRELDIDARLEAITDNAWFWVQVGEPFDAAALARGAEAFSAEVYPRLREVFGSEWSPGVDNDPRVHVLHHEPVPGIAGYFSGADEVTAAVDPDSNALEMFYVNLSVYPPGSADYLALLAHEFQHMIHWHRDYGEATWVNEGLSEVAPHLVGYGAQHGAAYRPTPDVALTDWEPTDASNDAHYAAAYLFFAWLHDRFGDAILSAVAAAPANGAAGVEAALAAVGAPMAFDDAFMDWAAANRVGRRRAPGDPLGYDRAGIEAIGALPLPDGGARETVAQHGADYWDVTHLVAGGRLELTFEGAAEAPLLAPSERAGNHAWWAGRSDAMHARLDRTFDLTGLAPGTPARLTWRTWHEIEAGWDQAYVLASADGARWDVLPTGLAKAAESGGAVGPHLDGASGSWRDDGVDLGAYAGGPVTVSFELVTDDAVSLGGWAVDDLALNAVGWSDDVEYGTTGTGGDGWRSAGWHVAPESLPQRWGLQALVDDGRRVAATRFQVDDDGRARIALDAVPPSASVTVIVSGLTPLIRGAAAYALEPVSGSASGASSSSGAYPRPAAPSSGAAYPPPSPGASFPAPGSSSP